MMVKRVSYPTPFLLVDLDKVREKVRTLKAALPDAEIFYAMKANPDPHIVTALIDEGCGVEVASAAQLCQLIDHHLPANRIISSNPVKSPHFLTTLHVTGVRSLAFDSAEEVDKIARYAPGSQVYLRLKTDNSGADWPLSRKFGADVSEAPALLYYAAAKGLAPSGLTFHVGSQCRNVQNWQSALETCTRVIDQVSGQMALNAINLGGGLPVQHTKEIPALSEIVDVLQQAQSALFQHRVRYQLEPGRFLVGESAVLVTSVIGKARRNEVEWLYLDAGVFNGLMETVGGIDYDFDFDIPPGRPVKTFTVAGPSCDSMDVMFKGRRLPDLNVNDRIYILNAGAYTSSYASHFNGFAPPAVLYTEEFQRAPAHQNGAAKHVTLPY